MIRFSDLLFGKKVMVSGDQIIDNDVADCAYITFYPRAKHLTWQKEILAFLSAEYTKLVKTLWSLNGYKYSEELVEELNEIQTELYFFEQDIKRLRLHIIPDWYMEIRGERKNTLKIVCPRCDEAFVDIVFDADGVRGEYLCFHCREYLKHKEVSE